MSEQFLVIASQVSILGGIVMLSMFYAVITLLNAFAYAFTKSKRFFNLAVERAHGLRPHIAQIRTSKNNTKAIGA